jgi:OOP family OmpA-OmpF porin
MVGGWSFGPAELVPGVNSDADDMQPYIRQDGREMVFASNRSSGQGSFDIWSTSRDSIANPWSPPENLGPNVNSSTSESRPSLSWDGTMLLFGTTRAGVEGASDIFFTTRGYPDH